MISGKVGIYRWCQDGSMQKLRRKLFGLITSRVKWGWNRFIGREQVEKLRAWRKREFLGRLMKNELELFWFTEEQRIT